MKTPIRKTRCATYTRKSSEEGLEMEFNSLDAQREAARTAFPRTPVHTGRRNARDGRSHSMLTSEGHQSPLNRLAGGGDPVLHWHGDTFDLPAGAIRLASTSMRPPGRR